MKSSIIKTGTMLAGFLLAACLSTHAEVKLACDAELQGIGWCQTMDRPYVLCFIKLWNVQVLSGRQTTEEGICLWKKGRQSDHCSSSDFPLPMEMFSQDLRSPLEYKLLGKWNRPKKKKIQEMSIN